jgi:hypothetical protein
VLYKKKARSALCASLPLVLTVGLGLGLSATASVAAADTGSDPVVLDAAPRAVPRATQILNAGTTGFLFVQENDDRLLWTDYATATTTALSETVPAPTYDIDTGYLSWSVDGGRGYFGNGSDTVALYEETPAPHVTLQQGAGTDGATAEVPLPNGQEYVGTFGDTVLTVTGSLDFPTGFHLLALDGGAVTDRQVTGLPDGFAQVSVEDSDARSVILRYRGNDATDDYPSWVILDIADGTFSALPDRPDPDNGWEVSGFRLAPDSILRLRPGRGLADVLDRDDVGADPRTVDTASFSYEAELGIVGESLLGVERVSPGDNLYRGQPLRTLPIDGSAGHTVMAPAAHQIVQAPDGSVLVAGAEQNVSPGDLDWGIYRVAQAADGSMTRTRLTAIDAMPAQIYGLSLGSGILTTADNSTLYEPATVMGAYRSTWLATSGSPAAVRSSVDGLVNGRDGDCDETNWRCIVMFANGTGYHGRRNSTESGLTMVRANGATDWGPSIDTGDYSPALADYSGRYAVIDGASSGYQYIGRFPETGDTGTVLLKRDRVAAAVWGATLWSGADSGSTVTATALPAGSVVETFKTRSGCTPSTLQAVGRWVYWSCGDAGPAGFYDRTTKTTSTAPTGFVLLGDGYLVQRPASKGLVLFDLHNGLPASGAYTDLPSRVLVTSAELGAKQRERTSWTVDRFGGAVAYADDEQRVHIVPTGIPASALTVIDTVAGASSLDLKNSQAAWAAKWWLSKPASSWKVVVRNKATGAVVRTLSGGEARGLVATSWDGKDATGKPVANGTYAWTLTATPADGEGASLARSGTMKVTGGAAVRRDHVASDGVGDLLTLSSSGSLTFHKGDGAGKFTDNVSGTGWSTSVMAVPFGDTNGDRCNDVLVRLASGTLRAYKPACGKALTTATAYTSLGTGFEQYNVLTSPGDMTGDGRADLIVRKSSNGVVYLYKGTSAGKLSSRVKIASDWSGYKKIVGVGDLNGDGYGDVVAQDKANVLWRYSGNGKGGFKGRVKIASGWGSSYNAVVGVGDITGDGKADLVSRDTSGNLWRYNGDGKGSFGGRTKIATGWKGYKGLF